ncbi:cytochrome-c peroxidase, partial [Xanthomonas sp. Kuri4-1]
MFAQTARPDPSSLRACYAGPRARWPLPQVQPGVAWQELAPLPAHPPEPPDNPGTPAKIALGRILFENPRLSRSGQIACASCHDPQLGWGDGRRVSFGHDRQAGRRNAPSVAMAGHARSLFWDGRAETLEAQALHPIQDAREMAFTAAALERRLNRSADYPDRFAQVFGTRRIGVQEVARALAAYQRSLAPRPGRFDRFLQGRPDALDDRQLRGLHLFRTRAGCMNCHSGPTLSDDRFHNLGLHFHGRRFQDLGRYEVTGDPADSGRFRTPSLRGVARTGPWMHNGLFADLHSVVAFYNAGAPRRAPGRA